MTYQPRAHEILLVEDSRMDIQLTREALHELGLNHHLHVAYDGDEALAYLRTTLTSDTSPRPDLVLLDLNLPLTDGRKVLAAIKSDPKLCTIPVLILSSSSAASDIGDCYRLHANSYLVKPLEFGPFVNLMRSTCEYWLTQVQLPHDVRRAHA